MSKPETTDEQVATWSQLSDREPVHLRVEGVDLLVDSAADGLENFFEVSVQITAVMARACGHDSRSGVDRSDLTTWKRDIAGLTGFEYAGVRRLHSLGNA